MSTNSYPRNEFLIGKWNNRVTESGWHLMRYNSRPEDEVNKILYCSVQGPEAERCVDIFHESIGSRRVPFHVDLAGISVIRINLENAL